jgi:hypothetical protein
MVGTNDTKQRKRKRRKAFQFSTIQQLQKWLEFSDAGKQVIDELLAERVNAIRKTPLVVAVQYSDHVELYADRRIDLRYHTMTRTDSLAGELLAEEWLVLDMSKIERDCFLPGIDSNGAGFVGIVQHQSIDANELENNEWTLAVVGKLRK